MTTSAAIKFCPECNNMLYAKEDKTNKVLLFACRHCEHQEEASEFCTFRNQIQKKFTGQERNLKDFAHDPTLPRSFSKHCNGCGANESVFFQSHIRQSNTAMNLYYVCVKCGNFSS